MKLPELVQEAYEKSDAFMKKWDYWTKKRKKQPTLEWPMPLLEDALGRDYVRECARKAIEAQKAKEEADQGS